MSNLFTRVLTLQRSAAGGFSFVNGNNGISLPSGQQFYIDSVSTQFFPAVSPGSADSNKYRKQKWLSIGLEGNSFRRYINENINLSGIPSGLEPGNFIYFTIEPKSSLLELGAGTQNSRNARYISTLRAKPYMVVENDGNRDNSYERTPSNLFTGVSGNNNFVRFHPSSRYSNLALQSIRFHPVIGNGYADFNLSSGAIVNIQPKNHHLETFININIASGQRINYGNSSRIFPSQNLFPNLVSGRALFVTGAYVSGVNGIYVANRQVNPTYFINERNFRIYQFTGATSSFGIGNTFTDTWVLVKPIEENLNFNAPNPDLPYDFVQPGGGTNSFQVVYKTTGVVDSISNGLTFSAPGSNSIILDPSTSGIWERFAWDIPLEEGEPRNNKLKVLRLVGTNFVDSLYTINSGLGGWNGFETNNPMRRPTGAYVSPKYSTANLPYSRINNQSRFTVNVYPVNATSSASSLRFFTPYFIFDQQDLLYFPYSQNFSMGNELVVKERINFKRPLSPNLHQAKKVNIKFSFAEDNRAISKQTVIKNLWPVEEKTYNEYTRVIECFDERDNDTYSNVPFYSISGKNYSFEQNELFIYKSRPDFNNPNKQNVIKW